MEMGCLAKQKWCRAQRDDVQKCCNDDDASPSALSTRVDHVLVPILKKGAMVPWINMVLFNDVQLIEMVVNALWYLLHSTEYAILPLITPLSFCDQPGIFSILDRSYLGARHGQAQIANLPLPVQPFQTPPISLA